MPEKDLNGRTIVVTGANTGIGRVTAEALAARGAHVLLACRSEDKTRPVLEGIRAAGGSAEFVALDLADLDQVKAAAKVVLERAPRIDVLVNNAGLAGSHGLTKQGYELTFGVNHLGTFLLTELLLDRLVASGPSRIVFVSSKGHYRAEELGWDALRTRTTSKLGLREYNHSKLCNVLYAKELSRRLAGKGVTTYSLHPGVVASDVWRSVPEPLQSVMKLFMISNEEGAKTSIHCATNAAAASESGLYYDTSRPKKPSALALDAALGDRLVAKSREWTASYLA